jgi:hypothetical protein
VEKIVLRYTTEEAGAGGKSYESQQTMRSVAEAKQGVESLLNNPRTLRIVIDSGPSMPKKKPPVKVRRIEWEQDESYPKGERWVGRVHGKQMATAVHLSDTWGGSCHYSLQFGEFTEYGGKSASIETAKRAAQSAFTKFVKSLLGG